MASIEVGNRSSFDGSTLIKRDPPPAARLPGGSPNMKVVAVPVGNFHGKPKKIPVNFSSSTF